MWDDEVDLTEKWPEPSLRPPSVAPGEALPPPANDEEEVQLGFWTYETKPPPKERAIIGQVGLVTAFVFIGLLLLGGIWAALFETAQEVKAMMELIQYLAPMLMGVVSLIVGYHYRRPGD